MKLPDDKFRLIICGAGDCDDYIREQAKKDPRIEAKGQVLPQLAKEIISGANVLANPRQNDDVYTRYSFPSKNLEYLATGNAVVYYLLDGMKPEYETFAYVPKDNSIEALSVALEQAATASTEAQMEKHLKFQNYIKGLYSEEIYRKVKTMLN